MKYDKVKPGTVVTGDVYNTLNASDGTKRGMLPILFLAAWFPLICDAAGSFSVVVPHDPISAQMDSTVTLPCWLSPALSAEKMEIRWFLSPSFNETVLHYIEGQIQESSQLPRFRGRAFLGPRSPDSSGLMGGDASLRLENVTVGDEGEFQCYISSKLHYDTGRVSLSVKVTGTVPVLSIRHFNNSLLNASCASSGWHPEPQVTWSSSQGWSDVSPDGLRYSPEAGQGLVSVSSWILSPPSDAGWLSCTMQLPGWGRQEGRVALLSAPPPTCKPDTYADDQSGGWKALFIALLIFAFAAIGVFIALRIMRKKRKGQKPSEETPETESLLNKDSSKKSEPGVTDFNEARKRHVDVIMDEETAHQYLMLSADRKRARDSESGQRTPTDKTFTRHLFVMGKEGFTSGCAYWEVGLCDDIVGKKESWTVGVVSESANRDCQVLTPAEGYWVLTSDKDNGLGLNTGIDSGISLDEKLRPQILGVLLDYAKGTVSFYNVEEKSHILTLFTTFREKVYPLFGPGQGDKAPLFIQSVPDVTQDKTQNENSNSPITLTPSEPITSENVVVENQNQPFATQKV
ncbi:hypothetical protein GJAV_G00165150 [Gymnothorax javanicus]|nr:hypothetical protein GJAV_G00165150 [Gymnothorax javanicus]